MSTGMKKQQITLVINPANGILGLLPMGIHLPNSMPTATFRKIKSLVLHGVRMNTV